MSDLLHLRGTVLVDDATELEEVWVADGRLTRTPPLGAERARQITGWVLPGLVDVHCHIGLGPGGEVDEEEAVVQAKADRDAGTLLVRDAGSPMDTRWVQARTDLPRLLRAGRHLARPKRYLRNYGLELDDVAQLPDAVAAQARAGDGWVKIVADWIDRSEGADADLRALWPADVLHDAVAAAHDNGARVTAHTFSREAIDPLLDAGIDGIEHGTGMDADQIAEAAHRRIPVTPTLLQVGRFAEIADQAGAKYPRYAARMRQMHARRYAQVRALHEAGVPLLMGSDAGGTIVHGSLPAELAEVARAGVPAADVVAAASWRARRFLAVPGIAEGASADVVVYDADPRQDVGVLSRPAAVILRGRLV
ncbi:amidohydrolase family protein [Georgenia thermotolerans]|uniref:Amidohydrolase family protein n=1 Tax=Georgenia thermotolerans TaxID=527326 RepID=A0A7J5UK66_9MICO|nr:amidohydrolase family protein [Georgenia thermotolerans]KAE8762778.1 amidohydrolase family protein [Georgenia thermotolerans]